MNGMLRCVCGVVAVILVAACGEKKKESKPAPEVGTAPAVEPAPPEVSRRAVLADELGGLMETFGRGMAAVKDRPTWELVKAELVKIKARTLVITAELNTLPPPTPEERQGFMQDMKQNEDKLEKSLGNKDDFMLRLPEDVAQELMRGAGEFSMNMGKAQNALYGPITR